MKKNTPLNNFGLCEVLGVETRVSHTLDKFSTPKLQPSLKVLLDTHAMGRRAGQCFILASYQSHGSHCRVPSLQIQLQGLCNKNRVCFYTFNQDAEPGDHLPLFPERSEKRSKHLPAQR